MRACRLAEWKKITSHPGKLKENFQARKFGASPWPAPRDQAQKKPPDPKVRRQGAQGSGVGSKRLFDRDLVLHLAHAPHVSGHLAGLGLLGGGVDKAAELDDAL